VSEQPTRFGSTEQLVPVRALLPEQEPGEGALLVMRDGSFRMLVRSGTVNFEMKSPAEKASLTLTFGALVNSLEVDFPIQICSHSRPIDIQAYAEQFQPRLDNERTPQQIKALIRSHCQHFEQKVRQQKLFLREIYVVVPYKGIRGPLEQSMVDEIPGASLIKALTTKMEDRIDENPSDLEIAAARRTLELRSGQIVARLQEIGLDAYRLDQDEVLKLLYRLFHPGLAERQRDPGAYHDDDSMVMGFSDIGRMPDEVPRLPV